MDINIRHPHFELTRDQTNYIRGKVQNLSKYCERLTDDSIYVDIDIEPNKLKTSDKNISFQITVYVPKSFIRAEIYATSIEEAVDLAADKLKKQIDRYKGKLHCRDVKGDWHPTDEVLNEYVNTVKITKRKTLCTGEPMYEDEAVEQLELLCHSFFVFKNVETGLYNVIYKRDDGTYGSIELTEEYVVDHED